MEYLSLFNLPYSYSLDLWFIFILTQALFRGINLDCGCFDLDSANLEDSELRIKMIRRIVEDLLFLSLAYLINRRSRNH